MKVAAVSLLCQDPRVHDSMANAGTPCPVNGLIGAEAAAYWQDNPEKIPQGSTYREDYMQVKKAEQVKGNNDDLKNFGLLVLSFLLFVPL